MTRRTTSKPKRGAVFAAALVLLPILFVVFSLFFGRYALPVREVLTALFRPGSVASASRVAVWQLRLPRALAAALVGASLAVFGGGVYTYLFSFLFALAAVVLSWFAGRISRVTTTITMILGGTIVGAFFSALVSIMKYIADPYSQLPSITFWFMGSFASVGYSHLLAAVPMVLGMLVIFLSRWRLNVLSMGEREAAALGLDVRKNQFLVIGGATLCTAAAVCISGTIGWVGLVIPHIGRMLIGNNNQKLIPVSISLGACFMVLIDLLSRTLTGAEIPIGILCALIGTPFFVYLLKKTRGGNWT